MKHILMITMLLLVFLSGCTSLSEDRSLTTQDISSLAIATTTVESTALTSVTATETRTATAAVVHTSTPQSNPTPAATQSPADAPTSSALTTMAVDQQCSASEPVQVEQTALIQGLVINEMEKIEVLGSQGLYNPIWLFPYPDNNTFSIISPNGSWIAFITYNEVDREKDIYSITIKVTNWNRTQEFRNYSGQNLN